MLGFTQQQLYTLRSAGARGLDASDSIDIALRWSEEGEVRASNQQHLSPAVFLSAKISEICVCIDFEK